MQHTRPKRGIVLFISIVMAVIMVMVVGAAIALGPANLAAGQQVVNQCQACRAAESGIQYALTQLRKDPDWKGNKNKVTVNLPDMYVVEDHGNVIGLLATSDGSWSQFRLRFNYQDGSDATAFNIDNPYVSVNNLKAPATTPVPRADGPNYSVTPASSKPHNAPLWGVSLAVEGKAGPAVTRLSPASPNGPLSGPSSRVTIEGIYQVGSMGDQFEDSAAMAANGFHVNLRNGGTDVSFQAKGGRTARIRSKADVDIKGGTIGNNLVSAAGEVSSVSGTLSASYNTAQIGTRVEKPVDPFYQLAWSDIKPASASGPKLSAGTYVWWEDGLHYYDMSYADYITHIRANPTDPGSAPVLPAAVKLPPGPKKTVQLDGSVYIQGTSNTKDFTLITREGAPEDPPPPPGPAGAATVIAQAIISNGQEQQYFQTCIAASGNLLVKDSSGNPMFDAVWSNAMSPSYTFQFKGYQNYTKVDLFRYLMDTSLYPGTTLAPGATVVAPAVTAAVATNLGIDPTLPPGRINPPGVTDSLTAADLQIEFKGGSTPVALSGDGCIRLTGAVKGSGGSITAGKDIRVVGLGADFAAGPSSPDGVNMYAAGDITFSTLQEFPTGLKYSDVHLKGIVYSWGNFLAKLGNNQLGGPWGKLQLDGMLVAFGGNPSIDAPGASGGGMVNVDAEKVSLNFDPSFLASLNPNLPAKFKLDPVSWSDRLP